MERAPFIFRMTPRRGSPIVPTVMSLACSFRFLSFLVSLSESNFCQRVYSSAAPVQSVETDLFMTTDCLFDIRDRSVLIAGAAGGLASTLARAMAERGARITL